MSKSESVQIVIIKSAEQRHAVASVLFDNGYTVRPVKIKTSGRGFAYGIEYFREDVQRQEAKREGGDSQ